MSAPMRLAQDRDLAELFVAGRPRILRREPPSHEALRAQALSARHGLSIQDAVNELTNGLKDLASDVHTAELARAAKKGDADAILHWGTLCAQVEGKLDCRCTRHCTKGGQFSLTAPPVWWAVYHGNLAIVEALLRAGASADAVSAPCPGGGKLSCEIGGQSALHLAVLLRFTGRPA